MSVPEAAVLAAAEAMHGLTGAGPWATLDDRAREYRILEARGAIEAAAPYLLAEAKREGWDAYESAPYEIKLTDDGKNWEPFKVNPYR